MAAEQSAVELTTRDVLLQVDRRLTLIEGDLRGLDEKMDSLDDKLDNKVEGLNAKIDTKIDGLRSETNARFDRVNTRIDEVYFKLDTKIDSKFHQLVGILLVTWISTMVTVLLK